MKKGEKKVARPAAEHWEKLVDVFFVFYAENFEGEKPSFDGSAPRDLRSIVEALKERAKIANVEWSEENAVCRLRKFFEAGLNDSWLGKNFLLFNLNRQKDKIFVNIKKQVHESRVNGAYEEKPNTTPIPKRRFGQL